MKSLISTFADKIPVSVSAVVIVPPFSFEWERVRLAIKGAWIMAIDSSLPSSSASSSSEAECAFSTVVFIDEEVFFLQNLDNFC